MASGIYPVLARCVASHRLELDGYAIARRYPIVLRKLLAVQSCVHGRVLRANAVYGTAYPNNPDTARTLLSRFLVFASRGRDCEYHTRKVHGTVRRWILSDLDFRTRTNDLL